MLAQKNRFHGQRSIRKVFHVGTFVRGRSISLKYTKRSNNSPSKAAVVVSKKVFKSAVKRNRVRRRVYDIVRHSGLIDQDGIAAVFTILSPETLTMKHAVLEAEIMKLLSPVGSSNNHVRQKPWYNISSNKTEVS